MSKTSSCFLAGGIEPTIRAFLDKMNSGFGCPVYKLSVKAAREALVELQSGGANSPPADIEDISIAGGPNGPVNMRIARPKGVMCVLPAVLYFHGGGWVLGDKNTYDSFIRRLCNATGAAIVFVEYSRSPEVKFPVALEEGYHAMRYVAENGQKHDIDGSRIIVAGDSCGANMATVLAMMSKERKGPKVAGQALLYPVTDDNFYTQSYKQFADGYWLSRLEMKWFWDQYMPDKAQRKQPMATPLSASLDTLKGLPPALVITAEFDVLRDEGEAYARRLMEAGVETTAVRILGTIHDSVIIDELAETPSTRATLRLVCQTIKDIFNI